MPFGNDDTDPFFLAVVHVIFLPLLLGIRLLMVKLSGPHIGIQPQLADLP